MSRLARGLKRSHGLLQMGVSLLREKRAIWGRRAAAAAVMFIGLDIAALYFLTCLSMAPPSALTLHTAKSSVALLDRKGLPLSETLESGWNQTSQVPLYKVPDLLR